MLWPNIFACFNGDKPSLSCTVDFLVAVSRACNIMNTILKSSRCGMSLSSCTYSMHLLTQTLPSRTRTRVSVAGLDIDCSRRGVVPEWHPGNINWHFHLPHKRKDQPAGPCTVCCIYFYFHPVISQFVKCVPPRKIPDLAIVSPPSGFASWVQSGSKDTAMM